jgi:hypothetical protein
MTLKLHRPDERGVITSHEPERRADWRTTLRSPRWNAAPLKNPEMNPTGRSASVVYWLVLGVITFGILMLGYGSGFWR